MMRKSITIIEMKMAGYQVGLLGGIFFTFVQIHWCLVHISMGEKQCIISGMSNDYSRGQVSNHNFVIEWLAIGIRVLSLGNTTEGLNPPRQIIMAG